MFNIGIIAGLCAMFGWGITDFIQSIPIRKIGPDTTLWISSCCSIIIASFMVFNPHWIFISMQNLILIFIAGLITSFAVRAFYVSLQKGELAVVSPISGSYSMITVMLLIVVLGFQLSSLQLLSIMLLICGIILTSTDLRKIKHLHSVVGVKESLVALVLWGIYFFMLEIVAGDHVLLRISFSNTSATALFFWSSIANGIFMMMLTWKHKPTFTILKAKKSPKIILCTSIAYAITWIMVTYGIQQGYAAIVAPVSSLYPSITSLLGVIFYKEKLLANQKIGIPIILLGLVLISL